MVYKTEGLMPLPRKSLAFTAVCKFKVTSALIIRKGRKIIHKLVATQNLEPKIWLLFKFCYNIIM